MNTVKVVVVDDSGFFRRRIVEMLGTDKQLEIIGTANDGAQGVAMVLAKKPDVVIMDVEMPVMNGIEAVRKIMAREPTAVLMFSSITHEGAQATLDALEAGAMDFMPKSFEEISKNRDEVTRLLCRRVIQLGRRRLRQSSPARVDTPAPAFTSAPRTGAVAMRDLSLLVIGASTGGPVALQKVLACLPATFPLPIVLIQHMPESFTPAFAQRLNQQCAIAVREAKNGDTLEPGLALLAPGGKQTIIESVAGRGRVKVIESRADQHYRPCVDVTFESAAQAYAAKVLAVVLTGMGADGREGARALRAKGARVWAQDEASSVIYGMPAAVAQAGLADKVLALSAIGTELAGNIV